MLVFNHSLDIHTCIHPNPRSLHTRWPLTEYTRTSKIQLLQALEGLEGTG